MVNNYSNIGDFNDQTAADGPIILIAVCVTCNHKMYRLSRAHVCMKGINSSVLATMASMDEASATFSRVQTLTISVLSFLGEE